MKKYVFLAASALALASCTSDDFLGNTPGNVQSNTSAIISMVVLVKFLVQQLKLVLLQRRLLIITM